MNIWLLSLFLLGLILFSAFSSAAEIGMMALNRYRLNHLVRSKNRMAIRVSKMLERPDRLLGVILVVNNLANIMASAVTTMILSHLFGDWGVALGTLVLTLVVLIFAEVTPKTFAASHPQAVAFVAVLPLMLLQKLFYPVVWFVNGVSNGILRLLRVKVGKQKDQLSSEELRTVVLEASGLIAQEHRDMLLSIFDLEQATVDDIMVPRNEIQGINIHDDWKVIVEALRSSQYTRLPIFRDNIDDVVGVLHLRSALALTLLERESKEALMQLAQPVFWVPERTTLSNQLLNFRKHKTRIGLVVNEYGDIQGLVTMEDILEEIVGEFTTDLSDSDNLIHLQPDGGYLIDGGITLRELNRELNWELSCEGPKTLSGLIIEYLQNIPQNSVCVRLGERYRMEVIRVKDNMVKTVRVLPPEAP